MDRKRNSIIILSSWSIVLFFTLILYFIEFPFIPFTITQNLWILPICLIPVVTIILEDELTEKKT